jgi:hypothetical protein
MRHLPILLGAATMTVCLLAGNGQAAAMPALSFDSAPTASSPVEPIHYYRHWYGGYGGYYPYRYGGSYYRPYGYYGYHHYRYSY